MRDPTQSPPVAPPLTTVTAQCSAIQGRQSALGGLILIVAGWKGGRTNRGSQADSYRPPAGAAGRPAGMSNTSITPVRHQRPLTFSGV
jgi:hypothetical protein